MNKAASFETLDAMVMESSARAIIDAADFVFQLWPDGEIADVAFGPGLAFPPSGVDLIGQPIVEIAASNDRPAIAKMLAAARSGQSIDRVTIQHSELIGPGSAARYSAHLTTNGKNVVMLGQAVSAEILLATQTVDAEIARYKRIDRSRLEADYRHLFQLSSEGLLIVDTATGLIDEANGNAADLLDRSTSDLIGTPFLSLFDLDDGTADIDFDGLASGDAAEELRITIEVPGTGRKIAVTTQVARGIEWSFMVVRLNGLRDRLDLSPISADWPDVSDPSDAMTIELLRTADVPVALTDPDTAVAWTNTAFAELFGSVSQDSTIAEVLQIPEHSLEIVLRNADECGRSLTSLSVLESRLVSEGDAYMAIVPIRSGATTGYGFVVHKVTGEADQGVQQQINADAETPDALADLVGEAPMKVLVRRSTDVIERKCIEAALRLTDNNRAAAANVLGLSRQSLYIKLRQHGLL